MAKKGTSRKSPKPSPRARKPAPPRAGKAPKPPAKSALLAEIPGASRVLFTANGTGLLVVRDEQKTLTLFDLATGMETPPLKELARVSAVALSADTRFIAMGTKSGILAVESSQAGKAAWKTKATGEVIGEVLFTLDGSLVIAAGAYQEEGDAWLRVYKTMTGEEEPAFDPVPGARVCHLALSPDGLFLAHSEVRSNSVLVWHLPTRQMASCLRLNNGNGKIVGLKFGHNVRQLYIAQESRVTGWNGENSVEISNMAVEGVKSLAIIAENNSIITLRVGPAGSALNLWNAETGRLRKTIPLPEGNYTSLAAPPGGAYVALAGGKICWVWKSEKLLA